MAGKFIELKDAAKQLGISPERLLEMREAGQAHGYRDGASWKFKAEEVDRIAGELSSPSGQDDAELSYSDSGSLSGEDFDSLLDVNVDLDSDSMGENGSSILISGDQKEEKESDGTAIGKEKPAARNQDDDEGDLKLADFDNDQEGDESEADFQLSGGVDDDVESSDELHFESDDSLALDADDSSPVADTPPSQMGEPSDSGLSLELDSQDDDGSDASLELPEDSDMLAIDEQSEALPDDATQLQPDEEFILSPSGEMLGDESSDSGSQVIALDDSEAFDEGVDLEESDEAAEPLSLVEDAEMDEDALEPFDAETDLTPVSSAPVDESRLPEAPFTVWNVLSLLLVMFMLSVIGMLMTDVIRNMWTWTGGSMGAGGLADSIVSMLGMS